MKILVALSRVPYPLEKGDKLRIYYQIRELSKKHEIILFSLNDTKLDKNAIKELKKYCSTVEIFNLSKPSLLKNLLRALSSGKPFQVEYFYSGEAQAELDKLVNKHKPDHIFCQLIRMADYVKDYSSISKTIDYMDAFSRGMERRIRSSPFYFKVFAREEYKRLKKYEAEVFSWFNNRIIISEQDKKHIEHPERDKIAVIPNGVDTSFFHSTERTRDFDLLFNGNMSYPPNIESAEYLVKKILPIIFEKRPGTKLLISGTNPSKRILAMQSANVTVTGWVEDIRENFNRAKVLIAPMQISIGLQNKLLEGMAMKIPCITSSLANNALGALPEKEILVADTPRDYADHVLRLLENKEFLNEIIKNAYDFILKNFNWETNTRLLEEIMFK